jgi:TnpA family transposase
MTTEEKIRAMEKIWDDLCKKAGSLSSPSWHKDVLHQTSSKRRTNKKWRRSIYELGESKET